MTALKVAAALLDLLATTAAFCAFALVVMFLFNLLAVWLRN